MTFSILSIYYIITINKTARYMTTANTTLFGYSAIFRALIIKNIEHKLLNLYTLILNFYQ